MTRIGLTLADEWRAAAYIGSQMRRWGIEPLGDDGGYVKTIDTGRVTAASAPVLVAGGMTLMLATDIRIASEHAMFDLSEVKRGILPGNGGTHRTIRQLPYAIAMEMLLLAKRLTAERAAHFGLINEVVPHDKVMEVAMERARELASMAPLATRAIKELAVRGQYMELNESLRMEHMMADKLHNTEDGKEGPRAFVEKRKANFQGR